MAYSHTAYTGLGLGILTVYYVEPSYYNLCGNLNRTENLANGLPRELTVIAVSDPGPV